MDSAAWIHHTCQSQWVTFLNHNKKCHQAFRIFIRNSWHPEFNISLTLSGLDLTRARVKDVKNTHFQVWVRYQGSQPDTKLHHIWLWLGILSASLYSIQHNKETSPWNCSVFVLSLRWRSVTFVARVSLTLKEPGFWKYLLGSIWTFQAAMKGEKFGECTVLSGQIRDATSWVSHKYPIWGLSVKPVGKYCLSLTTTLGDNNSQTKQENKH